MTGDEGSSMTGILPTSSGICQDYRKHKKQSGKVYSLETLFKVCRLVQQMR